MTVTKNVKAQMKVRGLGVYVFTLIWLVRCTKMSTIRPCLVELLHSY